MTPVIERLPQGPNGSFMHCWITVGNPRHDKHAQDMRSKLEAILGTVHPIRDEVPPTLAFAAFGSLVQFQQVCQLEFVTRVHESSLGQCDWSID